MFLPPPGSTRTDTLLPSATLVLYGFLSDAVPLARSWSRRSVSSVPSDEAALVAFSASPPYHPAGSERYGTGPTSSTSESWGSADMLRPPPNVRMAPTGNAGHGYSRPP